MPKIHKVGQLVREAWYYRRNATAKEAKVGYIVSRFRASKKGPRYASGAWLYNVVWADGSTEDVPWNDLREYVAEDPWYPAPLTYSPS